MDSKIKAEWVAALRSGEYKQGAGALRTGDEYCCLGVLCALAETAGVVKGVPDVLGEYAFAGDWFVLPSTVRVWADLEEDTGASVLTADGEYHILPALNDDYGYTFEQIADLIEAQL